MAKRTKARATPYITVNKLSEFIISNPQRQRAILKQLKYPAESVFASTAYKDSREAIKKYFINGFDTEILFDCISNLKETIPNSDHHAKMIKSEIESINYVLAFLLLEDNFENWEFEEYTGDNEKLDIKGVQVSVNPDLIIKSTIRNRNNFGLFKLHISKSYALHEDSGEYVANVLHHYGKTVMKIPDGYNLNPAHCISFDVFTESVVCCPKSVRRKFNIIESACQNIAGLWDSI